MNQDKEQILLARAEHLLSKQNFAAAVIAGTFATILAAFAYAIVTAKWPFSSGFAAVGIGISVGAAMQYLGHGIELRFAVVASVLTLIGCSLGNTLREAMFSIDGDLLTRLSAASDIELAAFLEQSMSYASSINLVFWLIAVWIAVFLVKRPLSRRDRLAIGTLERSSPPS